MNNLHTAILLFLLVTISFCVGAPNGRPGRERRIGKRIGKTPWNELVDGAAPSRRSRNGARRRSRRRFRARNGVEATIEELDIIVEAATPELVGSAGNGGGNRKGRRKNRRSKRSTISASQIWPGQTVYYKIRSGQFNTARTQKINSAISNFNSVSCLKWEVLPTGTQAPYVDITSSNAGCFANIGFSSSPTLNLGGSCSDYEQVILHEMMHIAGVFHQQSRPDRDNHVSIVTQLIQTNMAHNFARHDGSNTHGTAYNYKSIMHYGQYSFSKYQGIPTLLAADADQQYVTGTSDYFTMEDIDLLNALYSCTACYRPGKACGCQSNSDCSGVSNSVCSGGKCECSQGYEAVMGQCISASSVTCDEVGADCPCSTYGCTGSNTVCQNNKCVCSSGYKLNSAGNCVNRNQFNCAVAGTVCFCSEKGGNSACGSNAVCDNDVCKCALNYYNNNGVCASTPACNDVDVPCYCTNQDQNTVCSSLANTECASDDACRCTNGFVKSAAGICEAFNGINDGSSLSPLFTNSANNDVNWAPQSGSDVSYGSVNSNGFYLHISGTGTQEGAIEASASSTAADIVVKFAINLNNAVLAITFSNGQAAVTYSKSNSGSGGSFSLYQITDVESYLSGTIQQVTFKAEAFNTGSNWSAKLDAVDIQ